MLCLGLGGGERQTPGAVGDQWGESEDAGCLEASILHVYYAIMGKRVTREGTVKSRGKVRVFPTALKLQGCVKRVEVARPASGEE